MSFDFKGLRENESQSKAAISGQLTNFGSGQLRFCHQPLWQMHAISGPIASVESLEK